MTKIVFLDKLKKALGNDLPGAVVQEHVNYYHNYINEEIGKGRSEAEVIRELGDPWAIARNIIASEEIKGNAKETYDGYEPERQADHTWNRNTAVHVFGIDSWWKKLLLIRSISGDRSRHWWTAQSSHAFDSCADRNLDRNPCTEQTTMKNEVTGNGIIEQKKIDGGAIDLLRGV